MFIVRICWGLESLLKTLREGSSRKIPLQIPFQKHVLSKKEFCILHPEKGSFITCFPFELGARNLELNLMSK